jgi:hypothetical protein
MTILHIFFVMLSLVLFLWNILFNTFYCHIKILKIRVRLPVKKKLFMFIEINPFIHTYVYVYVLCNNTCCGKSINLRVRLPFSMKQFPFYTFLTHSRLHSRTHIYNLNFSDNLFLLKKFSNSSLQIFHSRFFTRPNVHLIGK